MKQKLFIYFIVIFTGFFTFYNALLNGFINDDKLQIVNPSIVHSVKYIPLFFISSIRNLQKTGILLDFYYKPLMFTYFSLLYKLGGGKAFIFHLFQIILHICNSLLVFTFLSNIFKKKNAFFLSLLFLVHPINEEAVVYISNAQDILFFFFGIIGLILVQRNPRISKPKMVLICSILFLSLLSKETGVPFMLIIGMFICFFQKENIQKYFIPFFLTISVYIILRIISSQYYFLNILSTPLLKIPFYQRVLYIPKILLFYIQEFIFPTITFTSSRAVSIKALSVQDIFFPILYMCIFLFCLVGISIIMWHIERKRFFYYFFFLVWFVIGIGFHLQLFPLDTIVAKRWFYFPIIGLLGIIGFTLERVQKKTLEIVVIVIGICILIGCIYRTRQMNYFWKDSTTIRKHTIKF